jgi:DNA-binding transcriptional ArsR family regulator
MSHTLPLRPSIPHTPSQHAVVDLSDEESAAAVDALASETARSILAVLGDGPATASDVTEEVATTLQNVRYHLDRLREAGFVVRAGTWYSSKGREMTVYALASERLELRIGATDAPTDPPPSAERVAHE